MQKVKNEPRPKFTGSYKKKCVAHMLSSYMRFQLFLVKFCPPDIIPIRNTAKSTTYFTQPNCISIRHFLVNPMQLKLIHFKFCLQQYFTVEFEVSRGIPSRRAKTTTRNFRGTSDMNGTRRTQCRGSPKVPQF